MAPTPIKKYSIPGTSWTSTQLQIQHDGVTFLWINSNNKYGPFNDPYVTIHEEANNGQIVAAAKMGPPGRARHFNIFQGNPDCTDLSTWPKVTCKGKWAHEYRFSVGTQEFAWRRTRDKQLGSLGKGHRDFKLVALCKDPVRSASFDSSIEEFDGKCVAGVEEEMPDQETILAVYVHNARWGTRKAKINFFQSLPWEVELWCLAVIFGVQEKISKNQQLFAMTSYGGGAWPLGNYI